MKLPGVQIQTRNAPADAAKQAVKDGQTVFVAQLGGAGGWDWGVQIAAVEAEGWRLEHYGAYWTSVGPGARPVFRRT